MLLVKVTGRSITFLECVQLLLKHDAPVKIKNGLGWTVLAEAVSYGNRPTSKATVFYNFSKCSY